MRGNGIPTIGRRPVTMQILIIVDSNMGRSKPAQKSCKKGLLRRAIEIMILKNNIAYSKITNNAPARPHSSHKTEKIKSVLLSGKNNNLFCVPFKNPLPKKPPEPIEI